MYHHFRPGRLPTPASVGPYPMLYAPLNAIQFLSHTSTHYYPSRQPPPNNVGTYIFISIIQPFVPWALLRFHIARVPPKNMAKMVPSFQPYLLRSTAALVRAVVALTVGPALSAIALKVSDALAGGSVTRKPCSL